MYANVHIYMLRRRFFERIQHSGKRPNSNANIAFHRVGFGTLTAFMVTTGDIRVPKCLIYTTVIGTLENNSKA